MITKPIKTATVRSIKRPVVNPTQSGFQPSELGEKLIRHIELDQQAFPLTNLYDSVSRSNWMSYTGSNGSVSAVTDNNGNPVYADIVQGDRFSASDVTGLTGETSGEVFLVMRWTRGDNNYATAICFNNAGSSPGSNHLSLRMRANDLAQTHIFGKARNTTSGVNYIGTDCRQKAFSVASMASDGVDGYVRRGLYEPTLQTATDPEEWIAAVSGFDDVTLFSRKTGPVAYTDEWEGHFCELVITEFLTEAERASLVGYLKFKYNQLDCAAVGDSISAGPSDWPNYIHENSIDDRTKIGVYQYGAGGASTSAIVTQWDGIKTRPWDWLHYMGGINDIVAGTLQVTIQANIASVVDDATNRGIRVALYTVLPFGANGSWDAGKQTELETLNTWIRNKAASETLATLVDLYELLEDSENANEMIGGYTSDGLHPNETGARVIATAAHNLLFPVNKPGSGLLFGDSATDVANCGSFSWLDNMLPPNDVSLPRIVVGVRMRVDGAGNTVSGRIVAKSGTSNDDGWQLYCIDPSGSGCRVRYEHSRDSGASFVRWESDDEIIEFGETATFFFYLTEDQMNSIYKDNVSFARSATASGSGAYDDDSGEDFLIGNRADLDRALEGEIYWVRIYKGALSEAERLDESLAAAKLIHAWEFDDGQGSTLRSGHLAPSENGTISGATWV